MEKDFWHERWQEGKIGFHRAEANQKLLDFWPKLDLKEKSRVLIPLCGKSIDLLWLQKKGFDVFGVELSPIALDCFFKENQLSYQQEEKKHHRLYQHENLHLYEGCLFDFAPFEVGLMDAIYDRASVVALPPQMRERYFKHITTLLRPGGQILMVTIEYPQEKIDGPPFNVSEQEVRQMMGENFEIEILQNDPVKDVPPKFVEKGIPDFVEKVYLMKKK
jgi:thiopurine S-methyltransferase